MKLQKVVERLEVEFNSRNYQDRDIYDLAKDIDIEDRRHADLHHYDRNDLISVVAVFVHQGIKNKNWSLDSWINEVVNACVSCKESSLEVALETMPCCSKSVCWDFCLYEEPKKCPCCQSKIKVVSKDPETKESFVLLKK